MLQRNITDLTFMTHDAFIFKFYNSSSPVFYLAQVYHVYGCIFYFLFFIFSFGRGSYKCIKILKSNNAISLLLPARPLEYRQRVCFSIQDEFVHRPGILVYRKEVRVFNCLRQEIAIPMQFDLSHEA
jgi:hypothetical protein